jgi:hypothetical protein
VPTDLSAPADGDVVVRPDTTARAHTRRGWLLLAIAAFQAWLWITRTWNLLTADEGRDTAFIVVPPLLPGHQAAHHRAAAGHHGAVDGGRGRRLAGHLAGVRDAVRRGAVGRVANALNNYLDRDVDRHARTSRRPTARDEVSPPRRWSRQRPRGRGVRVAVGVRQPVAALLATSAILFYVFVYTIGLKRRTNQAVVIGGAAGCVPVLTGWAAVPGGSLADPRPWLLFAIMFWWTPPHFWALAMKYRDDYAAAGLPMLPVTHGNDEATRHILLYSYLLLSIVLLYVAGAATSWVFTSRPWG